MTCINDRIPCGSCARRARRRRDVRRTILVGAVAAVVGLGGLAFAVLAPSTRGYTFLPNCSGLVIHDETAALTWARGRGELAPEDWTSRPRRRWWHTAGFSSASSASIPLGYGIDVLYQLREAFADLPPSELPEGL